MAEQENLKGLHWTQLKKRVEDAGGEWDGKDNAIAFLQGGTPAEPIANDDLAKDDLGVDINSDVNAGDSDKDNAGNESNVVDITDAAVKQVNADTPIELDIIDKPGVDDAADYDDVPVFNSDEYFSTVHGVGQKAKFCQNGVLFDAKHEIVPGIND